MAIITLTTDFGLGSPYAGVMKGVVLSINPAAVLVDLTHAVPPQDIRHGAVVLDDVTRWFPEGTIHVAVVDPGVGTERGIVYARIGGQQYVCPDNGLLGLLARRSRPEKIVRLARPEHWLAPVSATFHGRDIMAPVAARLSLGLAPDRLGVPQDELATLDWPEVRRTPNRIEGSVLQVDSFGNLISDIDETMLEGRRDDPSIRVECRGREVRGIVRTYGRQPPGTLVALVGSTGRLELAVVGGSAAAALGAGRGEPISVRWNS